MEKSEIDALNRLSRERRREAMEADDWIPEYEYWRHGGSYVTNVVFPSGAVGCVASARHTLSGKFESACFDLGTFKTRDAAARAERAHAISLWVKQDEESTGLPFVPGDDLTGRDFPRDGYPFRVSGPAAGVPGMWEARGESGTVVVPDYEITGAPFAPGDDVDGVLCWSCQDDAARLTPAGEGRCMTCPDDYSAATDVAHESDMSYEPAPFVPGGIDDEGYRVDTGERAWCAECGRGTDTLEPGETLVIEGDTEVCITCRAAIAEPIEPFAPGERGDAPAPIEAAPFVPGQRADSSAPGVGREPSARTLAFRAAQSGRVLEGDRGDHGQIAQAGYAEAVVRGSAPFVPGETPAFAVLLSSASRDTSGDDLVGTARYTTAHEASDAGMTIEQAQPGIKSWVMRLTAGEWRQLAGHRTAREILATVSA